MKAIHESMKELVQSQKEWDKEADELWILESENEPWSKCKVCGKERRFHFTSPYVELPDVEFECRELTWGDVPDDMWPRSLNMYLSETYPDLDRQQVADERQLRRIVKKLRPVHIYNFLQRKGARPTYNPLYFFKFQIQNPKDTNKSTMYLDSYPIDKDGFVEAPIDCRLPTEAGTWEHVESIGGPPSDGEDDGSEDVEDDEDVVSHPSFFTDRSRLSSNATYSQPPSDLASGRTSDRASDPFDRASGRASDRRSDRVSDPSASDRTSDLFGSASDRASGRASTSSGRASDRRSDRASDRRSDLDRTSGRASDRRSDRASDRTSGRSSGNEERGDRWDAEAWLRRLYQTVYGNPDGPPAKRRKTGQRRRRTTSTRKRRGIAVKKSTQKKKRTPKKNSSTRKRRTRR